MRVERFIGAVAAVGIVMLTLTVSTQPASAAPMPPFCSGQAEGGSLDRVVSGTAVDIACRLQADERTPHWLVLSTDGDPVAWTVQRMGQNGEVVSETTHASPEVIVPAADYTVILRTQAPSVVEVLTRESGLLEEVARAQSKVLLSAQVRAAPSGTNVLNPQVGDLTRRIATMADITAEVVHPFYGSVEAELQETRQAAADLIARYGEDWSGTEALERDVALAQSAFQSGQLDRVGELTALIQGYVAGDAQAADQIGRLDATRLVAVRAAVVVAAIAGIALLVAGAAVFVLLRRHGGFGGGEDVYEAV
ncbi:MAG: hypothetical protein WD645_05870 [Dehalococcoidia bacterium]